MLYSLRFLAVCSYFRCLSDIAKFSAIIRSNMKIAVVYNRESKRVINLFGIPNQERIGTAAIQRIVEALKKGKHQVRTFEGDKDLIENLEEFMPQVIKGERPGMVFNLSYGIQGQARYTHIPSILEMVGIPYVGSGPLAHSLSLDKVVTKMMLRQRNLPTPDFAVLDSPGFECPVLPYPLIVKPKNEAVSFGIKVVNDEAELHSAAGSIFERFHQPVLVECYIKGREINVGLIGNSPVEALPPCEIIFGKTGPRIYTYEDKTGKSGRRIEVECPAEISPDQLDEAKRLALTAFNALSCCDCARVDMRLDENGNFHILEVNSLPSLGEHGSYVHAAQAAGLDFSRLVNRLVEVASVRYFGMQAPNFSSRRGKQTASIFNYVTRNRERLEKTLQKWVQLSSRSGDYIGIYNAARRASEVMSELNLLPVKELTDNHNTWAWQSGAGLEDGTLLIAHLDVPLSEQSPPASFSIEPEWIYGDGVATSRGPLAMLEFALRSLNSIRLMRRKKLGVLLYGDEGLEARHSMLSIRQAASKAARVIVLRPGLAENTLTIDRRGQRFYRFIVEGKPTRIDNWQKKEDVLRWASSKVGEFSNMSLNLKRFNIGALKLETNSLTMHLPHRVNATLLMSYADESDANQVEDGISERLKGRHPFNCEFTRFSERPPLRRRRNNSKLLQEFREVGEHWDIKVNEQSSAWPSVAGLVPATVPVVCGFGPYSKDLYTPQEAVNRLSIVQRSLLLAGYLAEKG